MVERRRRKGTAQRRTGAARRALQGRYAFLKKPWQLLGIGVKRRRRAAGTRLSPLTRKILYWSSVAGLWVFMAAGATLAYFASGLPDTHDLWRAEAGPSVVVLDASGQTLATHGVVHGNDVSLAQMSPYLPLAVMAIEDRRFYAHWGVDPIGLGRALFANMSEGHVVQGGSTITQQLAKNVFLSSERTFKRKLQEALLAVWLEMRFSKDEILTLYLNRVYLGAGTYGVESAARRYFDKSPAQLNLIEAAMIAGLLKAPSRYAPTNDVAAAETRTSLVLDAMAQSGFITPQVREKARTLRLAFAKGTQSQGAQYFVDWVMDQLPSYVGPDAGELVVETTLHLPFQRLAESVVVGLLDKEGPNFRASQAALVSIDTQGAIRAMVGGRAYEASQFNRAVQGFRQPGSAFKPFVYLAALERGRTPTWRVLDAPLTVGSWSPANYKHEYRGEVTMQTALALSLNTPAVRTALSVGPEAVIQTAQRLGISSPLLPNASIALGTSEVSLVELTGAYVPFATGGEGPFIHSIKRIRTRDGRVLYERTGSGFGRLVASDDAGAMNQMLREAVEHGTGYAALLPGRDVAGKTGTTQDYRDAWFVGYTADLVTGVWVGNDDNTSMKRVTGGGLPTVMWHDYMAKAAASYGLAKPLPGRTRSDEPVFAAQDSRFMTLFERIRSILGDGDNDNKPREKAAPQKHGPH